MPPEQGWHFLSSTIYGINELTGSITNGFTHLITMENDMSGNKSQTDFSKFAALDLRVGRVLKVEDAATKKPTYRLTVDFGPEIGTRVSCGAYRNYPKESLLGKLVICIVNFPAMKMGPETSEVLILGVPNEKTETIYLTPQSEVPLGVQVF